MTKTQLAAARKLLLALHEQADQTPTDIQDSRDFADSLTAEMERQYKKVEVAAWTIAVPILLFIGWLAWSVVSWAI